MIIFILNYGAQNFSLGLGPGQEVMIRVGDKTMALFPAASHRFPNYFFNPFFQNCQCRNNVLYSVITCEQVVKVFLGITFSAVFHI